MNLIVIESPFAGDEAANLSYVRWAMSFCFQELGSAPYASHALYTQPGVLRDHLPEERKLGMRAGFSWGALATERGVFCDRGISGGMITGIQQARSHGQIVRYYQIRDWIEAILLARGSKLGEDALRDMPNAAEVAEQIARTKGANS